MVLKSGNETWSRLDIGHVTRMGGFCVLENKELVKP
jgi:hypothetical protein